MMLQGMLASLSGADSVAARSLLAATLSEAEFGRVSAFASFPTSGADAYAHTPRGAQLSAQSSSSLGATIRKSSSRQFNSSAMIHPPKPMTDSVFHHKSIPQFIAEIRGAVSEPIDASATAFFEGISNKTQISTVHNLVVKMGFGLPESIRASALNDHDLIRSWRWVVSFLEERENARQMDKVALESEAETREARKAATANKLQDLENSDLLDERSRAYSRSELLKGSSSIATAVDVRSDTVDIDLRHAAVRLIFVELKAIHWYGDAGRAYARERGAALDSGPPLTPEMLLVEEEAWNDAIAEFPENEGEPPPAFLRAYDACQRGDDDVRYVDR